MAESSHPEPRFYDEEKARAYRSRSAARSEAEARLLGRLLDRIPPGPALDAPCGEGRLLRLLEARGFRPTGMDLSPGMLRLAGGGIRGRVQALPFRDGAFPLVVCHRFLHHLPREEQARVLGELARVSGEWILLSFFHPVSLHGLTRRIRSLLSGRRSGRHATPPAFLKETLGREGFRPVAFLAQRPYLREYWLALFQLDRTSPDGRG